eukprot:COSAG03_NODE_23783_length_277_cov_0.584270_1_plen_41_part_01
MTSDLRLWLGKVPKPATTKIESFQQASAAMYVYYYRTYEKA